MKNKTVQFVMLTYDVLAIKGITHTDKIVLAYNWGDWGKGGYFATNRYAAGVLGMNIKTFEKSALKLKKLGLWKVRGKFVEPSTSPTPVGAPPTPVGPMPTPVGSPPTRVGCVPTPVGIESAILPLKTEVLLDRLLDNKLEKDKKELLDNAAVAANSNSSSLSLNNFEEFKETISAKLNLKDVKKSSYIDSDYNKNTKIDPSKYDFSMYKVFGPDGVPIFQSEMVMANYHAAEAGMPRPYSNEDIASAPSSRHAFITLEFQRFWKELEMHDRPDSTPPHGATSVGERSEGLFRF